VRAVSIMTLVCAVARFAFNSRQTADPSSFGINISKITKSGLQNHQVRPFMQSDAKGLLPIPRYGNLVSVIVAQRR
jgi:hypothetical protein